MGIPTPKEAATLEHFVDRRESDECWPWTGRVDKDGYGLFSREGHRKWRAHRAAWSVENGAIPPGILIRHSCDNPPCCNPSHLSPGTDLDNARDRIERGRQAEVARKLRCPRGHPLDGDNLIMMHRGKHRACRICTKASNKEAKLRYKAKTRR